MGNERPGLLAEKPTQRSNRSTLGLSLSRLLPFAVFVTMFTIFSIFANNFFTVRGVLNLLVQTSTFTILSIGACLVLVVGCIDFSLGAVIAFSGTAVVVFAAMGIPIWISMLAATILSGIIGLANGLLVARLHLPAFIATFAMAMVVYGLLAGFGAFIATHAGPVPYPANLAHLGDLANIPVIQDHFPRRDMGRKL